MGSALRVGSPLRRLLGFARSLNLRAADAAPVDGHDLSAPDLPFSPDLSFSPDLPFSPEPPVAPRPPGWDGGLGRHGSWR
jgi:hypothetical protein